MKIIKSRLFKILVLCFIIGVLIGIISFIFLDKNEFQNNIINYINLIKNNDFNYFDSLVLSVYSNIKYSCVIWIFGIIFFCSVFTPLLVVYKGISCGLLISSIIYTFKIKGLLYSLILLIPNILVSITLIILAFYSINFSIKCYTAIKNNKDINIRSFIKNYFYIFLILNGVLLLISFIETYITSNILKFIV